MIYLLDTNTIIYFTNGALPPSARAVIESSSLVISFVTRIELFAWQGLQTAEEVRLQQFVKTSKIIGIEEAIILQTITTKKQYKLKLPDALIAATALVYNLTLLSRNLKDFKDIDKLTVLDPHSL